MNRIRCKSVSARTLTPDPEVSLKLGEAAFLVTPHDSASHTIIGTVAVDRIVAPDVTIWTLSTGPVTFNSGSSLSIQINTATTSADLLVATGGGKFTRLNYSTTWTGTDQLTCAGNPVADHSIIIFGPNPFTVN